MMLPISADIFHLRDGREINGEIVSAADDTYILSFEVSKGVRDELTVKKSHVRRIEKVDPSLKEYERLKALLPLAEMKGEEYYQQVLDDEIKPFLKNYPDSPKIKNVKEIQKAYQSELESLQSGAVKVDGKWLTKDEQVSNQYEIDALIEFNKYEQLARSGKFIEALTILKRMELEFLQTKQYREAVGLALQFLPIYRDQLYKLSQAVDEQVKNREMTIERAPVSDRARIQRALDMEEARYQQELTQAQSSRATFLPVNRFHKEPIDKNLKVIDSEMTRLKGTLQKSTQDAGEAYRTALAALNQKDLIGAKAGMQVFRSSRAPKKYTTPLNDLFLKVQREQREQLAKERREAAEKRRAGKNKKEKPDVKEATNEAEKKVYNQLEKKTGFDKKLSEIDKAAKAAEGQ